MIFINDLNKQMCIYIIINENLLSKIEDKISLLGSKLSVLIYFNFIYVIIFNIGT